MYRTKWCSRLQRCVHDLSALLLRLSALQFGDLGGGLADFRLHLHLRLQLMLTLLFQRSDRLVNIGAGLQGVYLLLVRLALELLGRLENVFLGRNVLLELLVLQVDRLLGSILQILVER